MSIVHHKSFGDGVVKNIANGYIEIDFSGQVKKFSFPKAFDGFLTTEDDSLLALLDAEKKKVLPKTETLNTHQAQPEQRDSRAVFSRPYTSRYTHSISNPLVGERAQTIDVRSEEEMFELVGYIAAPYRVSSFEAEVPKDGRDDAFEELFPGQTYRPIELGSTPSGMPNKLSPQFRINFANLINCPDVLKRNMGKGTGSCVGRINKSKFVIDLVQNYGFQFGDRQDISRIRSIAEKRGYLEAFEKGYTR